MTTAEHTDIAPTPRPTAAARATLAEVEHHSTTTGHGPMHYVTMGDHGTPVVLVHGFPESWWAFRGVVPPLARSHRVVAVDLSGFGDSAPAKAGATAATAADDLATLVADLGLGPVHLLGQDLSGQVVHRVAAERPELVRSLIAVETGLPGFGAEALADVRHGGAWYIGALATEGVADLLLRGREEGFVGDLYRSYGLGAPVLTSEDVTEFARGYAREGGFGGASGLYRSLLTDGDDVRRLAERRLTVPVLAVGSAGGAFTEATLRQVADDVTSVQLDDVGHYVAQEAPARLVEELSSFLARVDAAQLR